MTQKKEVSPNELYNSRLINAQPEVIFKAFSKSEHLKNWWGPSGFTNTINEFNFYENGKWNFIMHGPDGKNYENKSVFRKIIENKKIVIEHLSNPHFFLVVTLDADNDKTLVGWSMLFDSEEIKNVIAQYAKDANEQNFDRLENEIKLIL